jgi:hypothetical protein
MNNSNFDYLIIGGGFYGSYLANILGKNKKVLLIDKNISLMRAASFANQTRLHEGAHYLKSMDTARSSNYYSSKLKKRFPEIIVRNSKHYYALPESYNSITSEQFAQKCEILGINFHKINDKILSTPHTTYNVLEDNYDPSALRESIIEKINFINVEIKLNTSVISVESKLSGFVVTLSDFSRVYVNNVYNVTYAQVNEINKLFNIEEVQTVTEYVEIPLLYIPIFLKKALTVIDGPYLSLTPFGSSKLHNLTSVIYSHHPVEKNLQNSETFKNFILKQFRMLVLPEYQNFTYHGTLTSKKITLKANDALDSRPLIIKKHGNYTQIIGTKISNIIEMEDTLDL